jgi:hypothetical protein
MDQRKWDAWSEVFTEDIEMRVTNSGKVLHALKGRELVVSTVRSLNVHNRSIHHGHTPEIKLTSPSTAIGIWALWDTYLRDDGGRRTDSYGYYEDHYIRQDGVWKIRSVTCDLFEAPLAAP